jgi:hypothetical protein
VLAVLEVLALLAVLAVRRCHPVGDRSRLLE